MGLGAAVRLAGSTPAERAQAREHRGAARHRGGSGAPRGSGSSKDMATALRSCESVGRATRHLGRGVFRGLPYIAR